MAAIEKPNVDKTPSIMTSSITGMGLGGITGLATALNTLTCNCEQQLSIAGMAVNYVPGLSSNYNISSFCHRPGQTRRWPMQRAGPTAQCKVGRSHSAGALHRLKHSSRNSPNTQYAHNLICKLVDQNERRRRLDSMELIPQCFFSQDPLKVELTEFYSKENSKDHHTEQYDLVHDKIFPSPVLRRGQKFLFAVRFDRIADKQLDIIYIVFCNGPKPSITKGTRVVLPVDWNTHQGVFQHPRDVIGSGIGMSVGLPRTQDASTITTSASVGPVNSVRENSNFGVRRSSIGSEQMPVPSSPLSPQPNDKTPTERCCNNQQTAQPQIIPQSAAKPVILSPVSDGEKWSLGIHRLDGNTITFEVYIPATAPIGLWNCWVQTNRQGQRENRNDFKCDEDIYIIFNPWCRDDTVYMENEDSKKEYILNDQGKVWCGTWHQPIGRKWIFGQFDDVVLPACVYLLERSGLEHSERGSPIKICRALSAMVNATTDEDGLMVGRYDNEYKDGVAPHAWTGSVAILERYLTDGGRPVEYGQCWVFSGLIVTLCRALGIPCRSVTNYVSAHDTNRTFTVDKFFDKEGVEVPNGPDEDCYDSCWHFHAWNDVWMQRLDLPQGFGGWQIIDSTPQEETDAIYRCGPASLEAVRRGEIGFQYDTAFVFSELHAEISHFQEVDSSAWGFIKMTSNQNQVGRKVVTKNPTLDDDEGDTDLLDITQDYKPADGNAVDRLSVIAASRGFQRLQQYYDNPNRSQEDVTFDLMDIEIVPYGQPFDCIMNIQNKSTEDRTILCVLTASSCYYTGAVASRLRRAQGELIIRAGQRELLKLHVSPQEYMDKLVDHAMVKVHAMAYVKQTSQAWSDEEAFPLRKPKMQIQARVQPSVGQECTLLFTFQNPLTVHLTDCYFSFEGPGIQRPRQARFRDIKPGELVTYQDKVIPRRQGDIHVVATFSSRQIDDIFGNAVIKVKG
ncbi:hemocyte protein-glutamine gamma-glutamyltransferase-like [Leptidea sinapis]|uniref:Transglutaminase-like domain-containing protein n=1 Tax=Leptidea sinapis TaxID=189913 RepID=A0A5E4Q3T9_9NEOP|nr:hemocyte protein-glutamine gamma-glutamyltransferase-like [Leptidea sinapis]VVC92194.1 unnamed protein product [Leptidea sinapis]